MTTFTRAWDATYKSLPEDDDDALEGAARIRHMRTDVYERMDVDHFWDGDEHDGKHKKISFRPIADPDLDADEIALYAKVVGTKTELFFLDEDGNATQMTFSGQSQFLPAGTVVPFAGTVAPSGFLFCYGQVVSRTTYAGLFAAIGTTYNTGGESSAEFRLPDLRGRVIAGQDDMGGTSANRLTSVLNGDTLGAAGGAETVTLTEAQLPEVDLGLSASHNLSLGGAFSFNNQGNPQPSASNTFFVQGGSTGISGSVTLNNSGEFGGGAAHPNLQPTIVLNYIIKT